MRGVDKKGLLRRVAAQTALLPHAGEKGGDAAVDAMIEAFADVFMQHKTQPLLQAAADKQQQTAFVDKAHHAIEAAELAAVVENTHARLHPQRIDAVAVQQVAHPLLLRGVAGQRLQAKQAAIVDAGGSFGHPFARQGVGAGHAAGQHAAVGQGGVGGGAVKVGLW